MIAELFVSALGIYAAAGLVFALWFMTRGVMRLDPAARGSGAAFRVLIVPGTVALWPLLLMRVLRR